MSYHQLLLVTSVGQRHKFIHQYRFDYPDIVSRFCIEKVHFNVYLNNFFLYLYHTEKLKYHLLY